MSKDKLLKYEESTSIYISIKERINNTIIKVMNDENIDRDKAVLHDDVIYLEKVAEKYLEVEKYLIDNDLINMRR